MAVRRVACCVEDECVEMWEKETGKEDGLEMGGKLNDNYSQIECLHFCHK